MNTPTNDQILRLQEFSEVFDTFAKHQFLPAAVTHAQLTELAYIHAAIYGGKVPNLSCSSCKASMIKELSAVLKEYKPKRARSGKGTYKGDNPKTKKRDESKASGKSPARKKKPTAKKKPTPKKK